MHADRRREVRTRTDREVFILEPGRTLVEKQFIPFGFLLGQLGM